MRRAIVLLLLPALLLPLAPGVPGQQPPPTEGYKLRVRVELVTTPLVVYDRGGDYVYDLRREEITLLDNGLPQQLTTFELASEPISLVLLVDTSQRVAPLLDRVRKSGILFTDYILGETGEAALITFDDFITLRQGFTSDHTEFKRAVEQIPAGGNGTRLGDALDQAVALLVERPEGRRRVIVAITEAHDDGSEVPIGIPLRYAQIADISIYTIALSSIDADLRRRPEETPVRPSPYPPGVFATPAPPGSVQTPTSETLHRYETADLLNAIMLLVGSMKDTARRDVLELYAHGTGALHYQPRTRAGLEEAVNLIGQDLHNQYVVGYRPSNRDEQGFHRIEVRISRPSVRVRARPGYYVGLPPG